MNILQEVIRCLTILSVLKGHRVHPYVICTECSMDLIVKDLKQCNRFCALDYDAIVNLDQSATLLNLELICRSDTFLYIRVNTEIGPDIVDAVIYKFHEVDDYGIRQPFYYHENRMLDIKFGNLSESSLYQISVAVFNKDLQLIGKSKDNEFFTLSSTYVPGGVQNITLHDIVLDEVHPKKVKAVVQWEPAEDRNCDFEIVSIIKNYIETNIQTNGHYQGIFYCEITNIEMGNSLEIGIRGTRHGAPHSDGEQKWGKFTIPSCLEMYGGNLTICEPEKPQGLEFKLNYVLIGHSPLQITWNKPRLLPDYYVVTISFFSSKMNLSTYKHTVSGSDTQLLIINFNSSGSEVEVKLEAHSQGGVSKTIVVRPLLQMQAELNNYEIMIIIIPLICLLFLAFIIPVSIPIFAMVVNSRRTKPQNRRQREKDAESTDAEILNHNLKEFVAN